MFREWRSNRGVVRFSAVTRGDASGERTRNIVGWARANIADLRISDLARFFQRFGFSGVYDIPVGYILAFSHKKTTEKKEPRR